MPIESDISVFEDRKEPGEWRVEYFDDDADRVATEVVVKGLIERDAAGALALTDRGRAVLRAILPDL